MSMVYSVATTGGFPPEKLMFSSDNAQLDLDRDSYLLVALPGYIEELLDKEGITSFHSTCESRRGKLTNVFVKITEAKTNRGDMVFLATKRITPGNRREAIADAKRKRNA